MASTNQSPIYKQAEAKFLAANSTEERIMYLEEMMRECPKHKSSEKMMANLKTRLKKLQGQLEKAKKIKRGNRVGIKKDDMQAVIIGFTGSGKSSLLNLLTNVNTDVADYEFTTKRPVIGMMPYSGTQIQLIENPALKSEYYDRGITNSADTLLILINNLKQISEIESEIENAKGKRIIIFNIQENNSESEKRKIFATLSSKKYDFVLIDSLNPDYDSLNQLKEKIFQSFGKIRVHTKEPGKVKSPKPIILNPNSTVSDVAEKILKGFSNKVKETRIWGPSSKFPGQKVGLKHKLKDLDVVEFKTA